MAGGHDAPVDTGDAFSGYLRRRVPTRNPIELQRLSVALYRLLSRGTAVAREQIAEICDMTREQVDAFLGEFTPSGVVFDEDQKITGFVGLSLVPTSHKFVLADRTLHTWCAFDALFLPEILDAPATLVTLCPGSSAELSVELVPGEVRSASASGYVVSIVTPDTQACCDNLRRAFCDHVNLFKDAPAFRAWSNGRHDVGYVTLAEAASFARQRNALYYPDIDFGAPQACRRAVAGHRHR